MSATDNNINSSLPHRPSESVPGFNERELEPGAGLVESHETGAKKRDWTEFLPTTEHTAFLKSIEWSKTHVGSISEWPSSLRQAVYQVIADSRPATLYWYVGFLLGRLLASVAHIGNQGSALCSHLQCRFRASRRQDTS
jgi:hypothetical protein